MQKDSAKQKPKSKSWFKSIFCCQMSEDFQNQGRQLYEKKRANIMRKKAKIQLSLLGSSYRFSLCKMSRKNVAIDAYYFKGTLPNPVNRYLSERIRGQIGLVKGEISSIVARNILFPVYLGDTPQNTASNHGQLMLASPKNFCEKYIDLMVYRPHLNTINSLLIHNTEYSTNLCQQLAYLAKSFPKVILMIPSQTILDQLGMVLPPGKEIQIESIMINGTCIMYVVYIGDSTWLRVRQEDKLEYVLRQLDAPAQEANIRQLFELMLQSVDADQIVRLLVITLAEEKIFETNLNVYLRLVVTNNVLPASGVNRIFKMTNLIPMCSTPNISRTGSFGCITAQLTFKDEELLNKGQKELSQKYEVESHYEEEFTLYGSQLIQQS